MTETETETKYQPTLTVADHDVHQRVRDLIEEHHQPLHAAGVTVTVLMSRKELRHHGARAAAIARITSPRERTLGNSDATITISTADWEEMSAETQAALLDHELTHLRIAKLITPNRETTEDEIIIDPETGDECVAALDDNERPRLKIRPHDHTHGWFDDVAKRHGANSVEVQQARVWAQTEMGQLVMFDAGEMRATGTDGGKIVEKFVPGKFSQDQIVDAVREVARKRGAKFSVVDAVSNPSTHTIPVTRTRDPGPRA